MKKSIVVFIFILIQFSLRAQALSGTYTIGGAAPDYTTINAAVNALTTQGVNGAISFLIRNGTYNESIFLPAIAGASANNTITFRSQSGDSTAVVLNWTTTSSVSNGIFLNQTAFVRFHQLTVRQPSSVNNNAVMLIARGHNITISSCVLWGHQSSTSSATSTVIAGTCDSNLTIQNNIIRGATTGISGTNTALTHLRLKVTGNTFFGINQDYCYIQGGAFAEVSGNNFDVGGSLTANAIFLTQTSRATVWGNRIRMQNTAQNSSGIRITSSAGFPAQPILVANNSISYDAGGALIANGIICSGTFQMNIVYNSVRMNGGVNSSAIQVPSGGDITILNNVFAHESAGTANHAVNVATTLSNINSNYNNLYAAGPNLAPTFTTLSAYQTASGREANSVSALPQFTSVNNLYASATAMNNSATPLNYVLTDINGLPRGNPLPDMGAFEQLNFPVAALGNDTAACDSLILQSGNNPGASWLWNTGATTSAITVTTSGSYWVQVSNFLGSSRDTVEITIGISPTVAVTPANSTACAGDCVQLQSSVGGGSGPISYLWQPASGLNNQNVAAPQSCISSTTSYTLVVTDSLGCAASSNAVTITLNPQPQLTTGPALSSCNGDTVLLSSTTQAPGCSFIWHPASLTAQPAQPQTPAWPPQGITTFTVVAVTPQGCVDTAFQQVTIYALPPIPVISQNGPQLQSSAATGNQWYLNGQPVNGATDTVFTPAQNGSYTVTVTDSNGCTASSAPYLMLNTHNGIQPSAQLVALYPNPASAFLLISSQLTPIHRLSIYSPSGQLIMSEQLLSEQQFEYRLDIKWLENGFYYLKINTQQAAVPFVKIQQ